MGEYVSKNETRIEFYPYIKDHIDHFQHQHKADRYPELVTSEYLGQVIDNR